MSSKKRKKNNTRNKIVIGGLILAAGAFFLHSQKCGVLKPLFKNQCFEPLTVDDLPTRTATDDYVQAYNRHITGYRENPTMFPENYYDLPFRYDSTDPNNILTSPGIPDSFGSNPINPNPNAASNWIRQPFFF